MAGTLYLVATPIGNLEDITHRGVRILGQADLVACEDTRQTRKLLNHYGIDTPTVSCHEHNEAARSTQLIEKLERGADIVLVSDAGTPVVSDPGYHLVTRAIERGIPVVPIPGPSAAMAALAASGLSSDSFHFAGFLPSRAAQRRKAIGKLKDLECTAILYEAPHRILDTLADLDKLLGDRPVVVARELTKIHEEFLRGAAASIREQLAARPAVKGEFTVLIGKATSSPPAAPEPRQIRAAVEALLAKGTPRMEAMKSVARAHSLSKSAVYRIVEDTEPSSPDRAGCEPPGSKRRPGPDKQGT